MERKGFLCVLVDDLFVLCFCFLFCLLVSPSSFPLFLLLFFSFFSYSCVHRLQLNNVRKCSIHMALSRVFIFSISLFHELTPFIPPCPNKANKIKRMTTRAYTTPPPSPTWAKWLGNLAFIKQTNHAKRNDANKNIGLQTNKSKDGDLNTCGNYSNCKVNKNKLWMGGMNERSLRCFYFFFLYSDDRVAQKAVCLSVHQKNQPSPPPPGLKSYSNRPHRKVRVNNPQGAGRRNDMTVGRRSRRDKARTRGPVSFEMGQSTFKIAIPDFFAHTQRHQSPSLSAVSTLDNLILVTRHRHSQRGETSYSCSCLLLLLLFVLMLLVLLLVLLVTFRLGGPASMTTVLGLDGNRRIQHSLDLLSSRDFGGWGGRRGLAIRLEQARAPDGCRETRHR